MGSCPTEIAYMYSVFSADDISDSLLEELVNHDNSGDNSRPVSGACTGILFFEEPSTRTKESFRLIFEYLGIPYIDVIPELSSVKKGETHIQTLLTITNYANKTLCIWRSEKRMPKTSIPRVSIINAGDGINEHPTQALGDFLTIYRSLGQKFTDDFLKNTQIAIIGDIENSRVARSNIKILKRFGAKITLVSPPHLLSRNLANYYKTQFDCEIESALSKNTIQNCRFLMFLRVQNERSSIRDLSVSSFSLNDDNLHLLPKTSFIMHPGPVNIGVELSHKVFNHAQSLIGKQVQNAFLARKILINKILDT